MADKHITDERCSRTTHRKEVRRFKTVGRLCSIIEANMYTLVAHLFCIGVLLGQTPPVKKAVTPSAKTLVGVADSGRETEIAALKQTVAALSRRLGELEKKYTLHESYNKYFEKPAIEAFNERAGNEVDLDLASKSFAPVTDMQGLGRFLICVEKVEAYLDGSKVSLKIGNTLFGNLSEIKYTLAWNRRKPSNDNQDVLVKWYAAEQSKEFTDVQPINRGRWNVVTAFLPGTKPDELGYLSIKYIGFGAVSFP